VYNVKIKPRTVRTPQYTKNLAFIDVDIKGDIRSQGEYVQCGHFADKGFLQMRTYALFGAKDLGFFESYGVSARTRGKLSLCGQGGGGQFCAESFMGGPKHKVSTLMKYMLKRFVIVTLNKPSPALDVPKLTNFISILGFKFLPKFCGSTSYCRRGLEGRLAFETRNILQCTARSLTKQYPPRAKTYVNPNYVQPAKAFIAKP